MPAKRRESPNPAARRGLYWVALAIAAVWIGLDQLTKWWAESALVRGQAREFIPGFMEFRLVYNPGAAFSLATSATVLLTVFASGVVVFLIVMARRLGSIGWTVGLGLLLGGAAGNLVDRLVREPGPGRGHVVDFLRFENFPFIDFPVFNVADIGVTSAAILIGLLAVLGVNPDGSRSGKSDKHDASAPDAGEPDEDTNDATEDDDEVVDGAHRAPADDVEQVEQQEQGRDDER